jgi:isochorismate hydrolase
VHPEGDDGGTLRWFFPRLQRADDPWSQVDPGAVHGAKGAPLYDKARLSALSVPAVAETARREGVLVLAGVHTHRCVLATAVDAARLDLCPVVVADACAARPPERHAQALDVLASGHAFVASTDALLAALAGPA